jgi:hypothetical protein
LATVAASAPPSASRVILYFTPLTLLVFLVLPNGYLLDIATSFMLKNRLHATPAQIANFRLLTALPVYLSFAFGLARDKWNPLGMRDRGFMLVFGAITTVLFVWMSQAPLSYGGLLVGMLLVMFAFCFVAAAARGLLALVSQEQLMSGRLSALWNAVSSAPYAAGAFASAYLAQHLAPDQMFLLVALLCAAIALLGLWKPAAVFTHAYDRPEARGSSFTEDIRRLVRHKACYPAVLLVCLSQFSPGTNTPLQFYLTNELHLPDAVYGNFQGILMGAYIPACMLYGYLCKRLPLATLLLLATFAYIVEAIPLLFVHSSATALWMALPMGLINGFAFAAYWDLALRSCPPGLQGTLMMLVAGAYELAYRAGDLVGANVYGSAATHGFLWCVILATATSVLMLPVLRLIPKQLIATADGEATPAANATIPEGSFS